MLESTTLLSRAELVCILVASWVSHSELSETRAALLAVRMERPFQLVQNGNKVNNNMPMSAYDGMEQIKCEPGEETRYALIIDTLKILSTTITCYQLPLHVTNIVCYKLPLHSTNYHNIHSKINYHYMLPTYIKYY